MDMDKPRLVIITDMDGCFLDHDTYSYRESLPAFEEAVRKGVPVSFCTSKSAPEIEHYNLEISKEIGIDISFPFVAENGSAVYVPKGCFDRTEYKGMCRTTERYDIIELNCPRSETIAMLHRVRQELKHEGVDFLIFTEMSPQQIREDCGLSTEAAERARKREYSDACKIVDESWGKSLLFRSAVEKEGFTCFRGGRYYAVNKGADKGRATRILLDLYRKKFGQVRSVGIGDSENDLPMLHEVGEPWLVQKHDGTYQAFDKEISRAPYAGPVLSLIHI